MDLSASASASTSALRLSVPASASRPARRLLCRVGRAGSRFTGSRLTRGALARFGFGGAGLGMILSAVVLMPLRIALLLAMFSRRLRSNALMTGSFFAMLKFGGYNTSRQDEKCRNWCRYVQKALRSNYPALRDNGREDAKKRDKAENQLNQCASRLPDSSAKSRGQSGN